MNNSRILYASQLGARLDSDVMKGGGTDDTEILQAALDKAPQLGSLRLVMDGAALVRGLRVHSNTTIESLSSACGFYLANGADSPIVRNANQSADRRDDINIQIIGGTYNGNSKHQAHHTPEKTFVVPFSFFGVENLVIRDVHIRDQRTFAVHLAQWKRVNLENIHISLPEVGEQTNQDGIHINGPGQFLTARNISGKSWDDFFAINADDGFEPLSKTKDFGPNVKEGDITDVLVDGLIIDDASQGIRMLSRTSRIDRVTIRNVTGNNRNYGVIIDNFYRPPMGNFGSIVLDGLDLYQHTPIDLDMGRFLVTIGGHVEHLTIRNVARNTSFDNRPTIRVQGGADVRLLNIEGFTVYEKTKASVDTGYITVNGKVEQMSVRGANIYRESDVPNSSALIFVDGQHGGGGIKTLQVSDVVTHNLAHVLFMTGGKVDKLQASNICSTQSDTASFQVEGGVVNELMLNAYSGSQAAATKGEGKIVKKRGDGFEGQS